MKPNCMPTKFVVVHVMFLFSSLALNKTHRYTSQLIRFPIGGERVMCHGSKLTHSLGETKLPLGKQQLELSTRMSSGLAP